VVVQTYPAVSGFISIVTALVSTGQTITLANYTTIQNARAMQQTQPFADVSVSFTSNTITITQTALANVYVTILVAGVR